MEGEALGGSSKEDSPVWATKPQQQERRHYEERNPFTFSPQLIRLQKDHELFEDGDIQRHLYLEDLYIPETEDRPSLSVSEFACHISDCSAVFNTLEEYEHHYNSLHRHVCCSCRRSLPSARLLDIHIQEWHDSLFTILAQKQDMYQCLVEGCGQKFRSSEQRKDHLIGIHMYPPDFRFDKNKKDKRTMETKRQLLKGASMEVVGDVCQSEGVCEDMCNVLFDQSEQEEAMETHGSVKEAACTEDISAAALGLDPKTAPVKLQYSYRVPVNVCFGHGSIRGFKGQRGKRK